jgi:hypothetical protein
MSKRSAARTPKQPEQAPGTGSKRRKQARGTTAQAAERAPKRMQGQGATAQGQGQAATKQAGGTSTTRPRSNGSTVEAPPRKPASRPRRPTAVRTRAARRRANTSLSARAMASVRRVPRTAWVCAVVAIANCVSWAILIPPLQGPDEQAHFAYVQQLAENGKMPSGSSEENYSPEELAGMRDLEFGETILNPATDAVPSRERREKLLHDLSQPLSRKGDGSVGVAASEPPLYYALQTIPYAIGAGSSLLTQLTLMRLFSALLTGLTALFVFMFVREALPGTPWAWTVGGLGAALSPLLGFVGGSIDPDALLFVVCAALFYCLARAFRRGFEPRIAAAIGAVVAIGILTKVNFVALVPGAFLGMILLALRAARISRHEAYRSLALACGIAGSPVLVYILINLASHKALLGIVSGSITGVADHKLSAEVSYIWQFYLPRLPGMPKDFPGIVPLWNIWFKGLIARYNWLETSFPGWVYKAALIPAAMIAGLCVRELYAGREELRKRLPELAVYGAMLLGLMVLLAAASFESFPTLNAGDSEPRYFLPMLALGAALLALAARGAGKRWGPVAGVAIVVLILCHNVLSQLLEISRYYHPL